MTNDLERRLDQLQLELEHFRADWMRLWWLRRQRQGHPSSLFC